MVESFGVLSAPVSRISSPNVEIAPLEPLNASLESSNIFHLTFLASGFYNIIMCTTICPAEVILPRNIHELSGHRTHFIFCDNAHLSQYLSTYSDVSEPEQVRAWVFQGSNFGFFFPSKHHICKVNLTLLKEKVGLKPK